MGMYKIDIFLTNRNNRMFYANLPRVGTSKTVNTDREFLKYLMGDRSAYLPIEAGILTFSIF
jgi:hypothetical protein